MGEICNIQTNLVFPLWEVTLGIWAGFEPKLLHPDFSQKCSLTLVLPVLTTITFTNK